MARFQMFLGMTEQQISKILERERMAREGWTQAAPVDAETRRKLDLLRQGRSLSGFSLDDQSKELRRQGIYYEGIF